MCVCSGVFNADISDDNSLFAKQLLQFCYAHNLIMSSKMFLPVKSYTYVSEARRTVSWLDHCISTADAHTSLASMKICYELATTDHIPVVMTLNVENIPMLTMDDKRVCAGKLDWSGLTANDISSYTTKTDIMLDTIDLPKGALLCYEVNCKNKLYL